MRDTMGNYFRAGLLFLFTGFILNGLCQKKNVLFIMVDDLRNELGCYGASHIISPNLDKLAGEGVLFSQHYVQVPTCGASRYSLLSGQRPASAKSVTNKAAELFPRQDNGDTISLPQLFQLNGYTTIGLGKISHSPNGRLGDTGEGDEEVPFSWDSTYTALGEYEHAWALMHGYASGVPRTKGVTPPTEGADVSDNGYADGNIADEAITQLQRLKDETFFLAVGFMKPHLPFACPKKYWDLYDRDKIALTQYPDRTKNVNASLSFHPSNELLKNYASSGSVNTAEAKELRHGYYACVSYVDAQVGKVMAALDSLGLKDNTIVAVWGDHGWHLGDLDVWCKHTIFDWSLKSVFMMRGPGIASGQTAEGLIESLDIYPTLATMCGLQIPAAADGRSFAPLLSSPQLPGKSEVFGYWSRDGYMAKSLFDGRYRFSRWTKSGESDVLELYDHNTDPGETVNIAGDNPALVKSLGAILDAESPAYADSIYISVDKKMQGGAWYPQRKMGRLMAGSGASYISISHLNGKSAPSLLIWDIKGVQMHPGNAKRVVGGYCWRITVKEPKIMFYKIVQ